MNGYLLVVVVATSTVWCCWGYCAVVTCGGALEVGVPLLVTKVVALATQSKWRGRCIHGRNSYIIIIIKFYYEVSNMYWPFKSNNEKTTTRLVQIMILIWQMTYVLEQCSVMDVVQLPVLDWLMKSYLVELEAIQPLQNLLSFREHSAETTITENKNLI